MKTLPLSKVESLSFKLGFSVLSVASKLVHDSNKMARQKAVDPKEQHRQHMEEARADQRGFALLHPFWKDDERLEFQRVCMRRLRAKRRGQSIDSFPPYLRHRHPTAESGLATVP